MHPSPGSGLWGTAGIRAASSLSRVLLSSTARVKSSWALICIIVLLCYPTSLPNVPSPLSSPAFFRATFLYCYTLKSKQAPEPAKESILASSLPRPRVFCFHVAQTQMAQAAVMVILRHRERLYGAICVCSSKCNNPSYEHH